MSLAVSVRGTLRVLESDAQTGVIYVYYDRYNIFMLSSVSKVRGFDFVCYVVRDKFFVYKDDVRRGGV